MAPPIHVTTTPWDKNYSEIIDVRSPGEYQEDHIPGAINLPVLDNAERAKVGTIYKQVSPFEARKIGAALVSQNIGQHLQQHFLTQPKHYHPLIYCWRGGQRSNSLAHILNQIGWQTTLLQGGYKTYRAYVREQLSCLPEVCSFRIVCGYTGSAKTYLLQQMQTAGMQVLDLEAIANHRGSLLGQIWQGDPTPQPSQKWFESQLCQVLQQMDPAQPIWLESESSVIGKLQIPQALWDAMGRSPCIEMQTPMAVRVQWLLAEYPHFVEQPEALKLLLSQLVAKHGRATINHWFELIDQQRWPEFVTDILDKHYDPAYRRSLSSQYRKPLHTITLRDLNQVSINQVIQQLAAIDL